MKKNTKCINHPKDCGCATCWAATAEAFREAQVLDRIAADAGIKTDPDAKAAADELAIAEQLDGEEAEREARELADEQRDHISSGHEYLTDDEDRF